VLAPTTWPASLTAKAELFVPPSVPRSFAAGWATALLPAPTTRTRNIEKLSLSEAFIAVFLSG